MALELLQIVYTDDAGENLYMQDATGSYSASNPGGYGAPNATSASMTSSSIVVNINGVAVTYSFTLASNVVTAATVTLGSGTPIDILADLDSTVWPFVDANPFNITPSYWDDSLPTLEDVNYNVRYTVSNGTPVSTTDNYMYTFNTACCISQSLTQANMNDREGLVNKLIPFAYMLVAQYNSAAGSITAANAAINKAYSLCNNDSVSGCGCS